MTERSTVLESEASQLHLAQTEIRDLMATIAAMRDELESMKLDKETSVQEAVSAANDEIRQLQATAAALREELELLQIDKEESVQRTVAEGNDGKIQLQETSTHCAINWRSCRSTKRRPSSKPLPKERIKLPSCKKRRQPCATNWKR